MIDAEKFDKIYQEVVSLWPEEIDVKNKIISGETAAHIPNLIACYDKIDKAVYEKDDLYGLVNWAIFKALHRLARGLDSDVVWPHHLRKNDIFTLCVENEKFVSKE